MSYFGHVSSNMKSTIVREMVLTPSRFDPARHLEYSQQGDGQDYKHTIVTELPLDTNLQQKCSPYLVGLGLDYDWADRSKLEKQTPPEPGKDQYPVHEIGWNHASEGDGDEDRQRVPA